jgi:Reverse transcriptase (RNA-dependent DNA polymerase)
MSDVNNTVLAAGGQRMMSPSEALIGVAEMAISGHAASKPDPSKVSFQQSMGIASARCRSLRELFVLVPIVYRPRVTRALNELATTARKLAEAKEALSKLESWRGQTDVKKLPPFLAALARVPVYALTDRSQTQSVALRVTLQGECNKAVVACLDAIFEARTAEVTRLAKSVAYDSYAKVLRTSVDDTHAEVCKHNGLTTAECKAQCEHTSGLTAYPLAYSLYKEYERTWTEIPMLGKRTVDLYLAAAANRTSIFHKKVALLDKSQRMDVDPPVMTRKSVEQLVRDAMKVLQLGNKADLVEKRKRRLEEEGRPEIAKRRKTTTTSSEACGYPSAIQETTGPEGDVYEDTRKDAEALEEVIGGNWVWNKPGSYPDVLVELPMLIAMKCIWLKTPVEILNFQMTRGRIHIQQGLSIPSEVMKVISSGKKFLLPIRRNEDLVTDAFDNFCHRIRWRAHYMDDEKLSFDQDYWVRSSAIAEAIPDIGILESGLQHGKASLRIQLVKPVQTPYQYTLTDTEQTRQWLISNECLVLPSDKNLGYAIVKGTWYREQLRKIISTEVFEPLEDWVVTYTGSQIWKYLNSVVIKLESINEFDEGMKKQLRVFLLSASEQAVESEFEFSGSWVPELCGIPKLKNWTLRPIVPATTRGWVLGPLAKLISKLLKPYVRTFPTICESSRELAKELSFLKLPHNKRLTLVTADVVSFYTNVTVDSAEWQNGFLAGKSTAFQEFFREAVSVVNSKLLIKYGETVYRQRKGLAMGVGCSPDIANLYAAGFEQEFAKRSDILYFKRYMDDVFMICQTDHGDTSPVKQIMGNLRYENLTLKWVESESSVVFLDMNIWLNRQTQSVEFCPYSKPLNHYERIPWDSGHPLWMKKGTYVGELSRLAGISSSPPHYVEAIKSLQRIYSNRGYPSGLINSWTKDNAERRWRSRYEDKMLTDPPLVLKSWINPVWEGIDMNTVYQAMISEWKKDATLEELTTKRLIVSRAKPYWLGLDQLTRLWNRSVLTVLEDDTWERFHDARSSFY